MLVILMPSMVFSNLITFKVGYFIPQDNSPLWEDEFNWMSFKKSDFLNSGFSFTYEYFFSREISILFGLDSYTQKKLGTYEGYTAVEANARAWAYSDSDSISFQNPFLPSHVFSVSSSPVQLSIKLTPLGRINKIIPFIGGGVGVYVFSVRRDGMFIDFNGGQQDEDLNVIRYPVYDDLFRDDSRFAVGFHAFGGFMVPIANRISVEAEFKYNRAQGNLKDFNFLDYETFDLSGYQITFGVNYWF